MKRMLIAFPVILVTVFVGNSFANGGHHSNVKDSTKWTISAAADTTANYDSHFGLGGGITFTY